MTEVYRAIWVVAYRELLRFIADRSRLVSAFAFPLMFLVVFGAGFSRIIGDLGGEISFVQFMYPGIMAMTVIMSSLFAGMSVVWDREFGFLKEVLVAPLSRVGIVIGKAVGGSFAAMVQGTVMLVIAPIVGVTLTPLIVLKLLPIILILSLSLSGIGILVATRMRSQQGFQFVVQLMIFPLIFLSGVFFPIDGVPTWLQIIAKINPLSYGVDAIRLIFLGPQLVNPLAESANGFPLGLSL
ncbi:MAG: ABC transporter permease, partial [Chloroflexi bacterium]|nr:ABC transporter permease [Chloroflexota bacterium]